MIIEKNGMKKVEFARRLKIDQSYVTQLIKGRTRPSDRLIDSICREFHVNEYWLRTGEGEMSTPPPKDALDELIAEYGLSVRERILVEKILSLSPKAREAVINYMIDVATDIVATINMEGPAAAPPESPDEVRNVHDWTREEMDAAYLRQMDDEAADREKGTGGESTGSRSASGGGCA